MVDNIVIWYNDKKDLFIVDEFGSGENLLRSDRVEGYEGYTLFGLFRGLDDMQDPSDLDDDFDSENLSFNGEELVLKDGGMVLYKSEPVLDSKRHLNSILRELDLEDTLDDWSVFYGE